MARQVRKPVITSRPVQFDPQPQSHRWIVGHGLALAGQHVIALSPVGSDGRGGQVKEQRLVDIAELNLSGEDLYIVPIDVMSIPHLHSEIGGNEAVYARRMLSDDSDVDPAIGILIDKGVNHSGNPQGE